MIPDLIYDVGMHNGDDTAYYLSKGFHVVGIEANPVWADFCRRRFSTAISNGNLLLLNIGISAREGVQTFWINQEHTEFSSFIPEVAARAGKEAVPIKVTGVRFASILREHGIPFYLKIDIERHDVHCICALDANDLPTYVSIEAHELRYLQILQRFGYNAFKCVDQTAHNFRRDVGPTWVRWCRRKALCAGELLRMYAPTFKRGSSGPFGEETSGEWKPLDEVMSEWSLLSSRGGRLYRRGWFDFHATVRS
jgi:FkbM family methyltransferase